ncbi:MULTISPECIES: hypothetical protein [unclassified Paludibacterium]|uniref:hypothetical protein n=1 Tax=unclassified Paludibacterium TaxID=2618429 RepID=UPI001C055B79|nr:hypothetical protein [Paludibacterium sp. B53371]BEV71378.1 hypothetical protein THUN1379_08600 [Paludibacterium sp. THUN1379]
MKPRLMPDLQEAIELTRFWTDFEPSDVDIEQHRIVSCILLAYIDILEQEIDRLRSLYPEDVHGLQLHDPTPYTPPTGR